MMNDYETELFPVPADKAGKFSIEVTDKTGRLFQRKEFMANAGENKITLDLSKYTNGTYMVNVLSEKQRRTVQVVKTN